MVVQSSRLMGASKEEEKKKNEEGAALFLGSRPWEQVWKAALLNAYLEEFWHLGKNGIPEFPSPRTCFSLASNRSTIQPLLFFTQWRIRLVSVSPLWASHSLPSAPPLPFFFFLPVFPYWNIPVLIPSLCPLRIPSPYGGVNEWWLYMPVSKPRESVHFKRAFPRL